MNDPERQLQQWITGDIDEMVAKRYWQNAGYEVNPNNYPHVQHKKLLEMLDKDIENPVDVLNFPLSNNMHDHYPEDLETAERRNALPEVQPTTSSVPNSNLPSLTRKLIRMIRATNDKGILELPPEDQLSSSSTTTGDLDSSSSFTGGDRQEEEEEEEDEDEFELEEAIHSNRAKMFSSWYLGKTNRKRPRTSVFTRTSTTNLNTTAVADSIPIPVLNEGMQAFVPYVTPLIRIRPPKRTRLNTANGPPPQSSSS